MKLKEFGTRVWDDVYVGIDQSYTGFAITFLDQNLDHYTTVYKDETSGILRLHKIKQHLIDSLRGRVIRDVAMEGYAFGSQRANMLGELGGMVKLALFEDFDLYPLIVPPTVLKKYATGQGTKVSKSQIMLSVYKKWGVDLPDDNAADSYVLARIAKGGYALVYEKEIVSNLKDPKFREK